MNINMNILENIQNCLIKDRHSFQKQYQRINHIHNIPQKEAAIAVLQEKIAQSIAWCAQKKAHLPTITYPDLPIVSEKEKIIQMILDNPIVVIAGETGSGKTTQLPKMCLEAGLGIQGMIGHTQPRRMAARTIAARIASELHCVLGEAVGYKVRFSDKTSLASYVKIMTDGILLSEIQRDKWLSQYNCIIIDEAHERSLNIDFLLGYIKSLSRKRKDLKVIITSATIDVARFSEFFDNAPLISVEGRTYPIEVNYLFGNTQEDSDDPSPMVLQALELAYQRGPGDVLIFQTGEKEILELSEVISKANLPNTCVLPLYARQSVSEQQKIFKPTAQRKIIISTNVAETSITVPNIRFVIDSGLARISRYNYRNKLQRLPIEPISQASAEQRKGRCGRVSAGICYRLYAEEDFLTRPHFTEPEILRTNLAEVILKLLAMGFKDIESFDFISPPDSRFVKDGLGLLERLGAIDSHYDITALGRQLAAIPIEPKLGRMLIAANQYHALAEMLIIVSALSIIDPRQRPVDAKAKADLAHEKFNHEDSDFMSFLNLWHFIHSHKKALSHSRFRKLCHENYLSFIRVCEWIDIHEQLEEMVTELGFKKNQIMADYRLIHCSLLAGLIDTIGMKEEKKEYLGARNLRFMLHPSSSLFKKTPSWIMACEIIYTHKTYARTNAKIELNWISEVASHLLKRTYFEPYFDVKFGNVMAFEKSTLFGLEIISKKRVVYDNIAPIQAREIFIRQGFVEGNVQTKCFFYQKNQTTLKQLEDLENRIRKHKGLLDEERMVAFYEKHLPINVCSVKTLEQWMKGEEDSFLCFSLEEISNVTLDELEEIEKDTPSVWKIKEHIFKLFYAFEPQSKEDGATCEVPASELKWLLYQDFSWVIPRYLEDKIIFCLKALPKPTRQLLFPFPEYIEKARHTLVPSQGPFFEALSAFLKKEINVVVRPSFWEELALPAYVSMHFKVVGKEGEILAKGDDLKVIHASLREHFSKEKAPSHSLENENIIEWNFADLPEKCQIKQGEIDFTYYPALVDNQTSVSIQLFESKEVALTHHRLGLAKLYLLALKEPVRLFIKSHTAKDKKELTQLYAPWGDAQNLLHDVLLCSALVIFVSSKEVVRTKAQFETLLNSERKKYLTLAEQVFTLIREILKAYDEVLSQINQLSAKKNDTLNLSLKDMHQQLEGLVFKGFILQTPWVWLKRIPTYLKAITYRLEKLPRQLVQDKQYCADIQQLQKRYQEKRGDKDPSFRWKLEELRVSFFAQTLGTIEPVSKARLLKLLDT